MEKKKKTTTKAKAETKKVIKPINGFKKEKEPSKEQYKKMYYELVHNPYGKPLKNGFNKPMVLRFEKNGITVSIYNQCAVVSCLSNQWIAQNTTASYAMLYRMVDLSDKPIYDEDNPKENMMTKEEYEEYACGFLLAFVKCLDLLYIDRDNKVNNNLLYVVYDAYAKYLNDLDEAIKKILEDNPNIVQETILAETEMGNLMALQDGFKEINKEINK